MNTLGLLRIDPTDQRLKLFFDAEIDAPFFIDWTAPALSRRLAKASKKTEPLLQAIGKFADVHRILDTTAGTGVDGLLLAIKGFHVTLVERSPVIHALLEDAMNRWKQQTHAHQIVQKISLIHADAKDILDKSKPGSFDIILIDPMYPQKLKMARPRREMELFRKIAGDDTDADLLIDTAIKAKPKRVIVKRPDKAPFLGNKKPSFSVEGKTVRWDVYI